MVSRVLVALSLFLLVPWHPDGWTAAAHGLCLVPLARLWVKHVLAIGIDCSQADPRDSANVLAEVSSLGSQRGSCLASQHVGLARSGVSGGKNKEEEEKIKTAGGRSQRLASNGEDVLTDD